MIRVIFVGIRSMIDEKLSLLFKREVTSTTIDKQRIKTVLMFRAPMHILLLYKKVVVEMQDVLPIYVLTSVVCILKLVKPLYVIVSHRLIVFIIINHRFCLDQSS